jgi:hypothetical protein
MPQLPRSHNLCHGMRAPSLKLAALTLVVCALGLPINDIAGYGCLAAAAIVFCIGTINASPRRLAAAAVVVIVVSAVKFLAAPPPIEEGHNVFVVDDAGPASALERSLPAEVFRFMAAEFDRVYPPAKRCSRDFAGCWRAQGIPTSAYAFSGDSIYHRPAFSRRVTSIDIRDPRTWRTGFTGTIGAATSNVQPFPGSQCSAFPPPTPAVRCVGEVPCCGRAIANSSHCSTTPM